MTDVRRLLLGTFVRPAQETGTGAPRVEAVYGYLVRHDRGTVLLDTGLGVGDAETEDWYRPRRVALPDALATAGVRMGEALRALSPTATHGGKVKCARKIPRRQ